jgi:AraC-like DNA-binding protein
MNTVAVPTLLAPRLLGLIGVAAQKGVPRARLLEALGIDEAALSNQEARVPVEKVFDAWEVAMRTCRDDGLPVEVGRLSSIAAFGLFGYVLYTRPTLAGSLDALARYHDLVNDSGRWSIESDEGESTITWLRDGDRRLGMRVANEQVLSSFATLAVQHLTERLEILRVSFRHAKPRSDQAHVRHFGVAPIWAADVDAVVLPRDALDMKPIGANDVVSAYFASQADQALERLAKAGSWTAQVARVISASLGSGIPTLERVARSLGTTERTARRRLSAEGQTFDALVTSVQKEQAIQLLSGDTPLRDIAFALGFSDATAFSRAYKRWTGRSPSEARADRARK